MKQFASLTFIIVLAFSSCAQKGTQPKPETSKNEKNMTHTAATDTATFGGGCFWCTEAIFQRLKGVQSVTSGYSGGGIKNPTYREVCSGLTGHAECTQIVFDPGQISYTELLEVFFKTHDPTTLNRQGADEGTQYRSVVFYHNEAQQKTAQEVIKGLNESGAFDAPIVTEVSPFSTFYKAEDYHQNYFNLNAKANPYCQVVIVPKIQKFEKYFADKLKK